jgi:hypothetical protein
VIIGPRIRQDLDPGCFEFCPARDGIPQGGLFVELQGSKPGELLGQIDGGSLRSDPRLRRHHEPCQGRRRIRQGLHLRRALLNGRCFRFHPSQTRVSFKNFVEQQPKLNIGYRDNDVVGRRQSFGLLSVGESEARCRQEAGRDQLDAVLSSKKQPFHFQSPR